MNDLKQFLNRYKEELYKLDRVYVGDNRRLDENSGNYYKDGIVFEKEEPSKEKIFNAIYKDDYTVDIEYEVKYSNLWDERPSYISKSPRVDILKSSHMFPCPDGNKTGIEYKKVRQFWENGKVDEHTFKKLFNTFAVESYMNPHTNKSIASQSLIGDIEKLLLLPDNINKEVVLEYWSDGMTYTSETQLKMLDVAVNKLYDVEESHSVKYTESIHPLLKVCDIVVYRINGRK